MNVEMMEAAVIYQNYFTSENLVWEEGQFLLKKLL